MTHSWNIASEAGWDAVARAVAAALRPGDILALQGPLGAGKTTFMRALAAAMDAVQTPKSPTFSLLRTYTVRHGDIRRLLHVDAYRIEDVREIVPLDLDEALADGDAVLALEWPEHVAGWLGRRSVKTLEIRIAKDGREAVLRS